MTPDDSWWLLMTPDDYWWLLMTTDDYWWLLMTPDDYWWLLMTPDDSWWLLITTDDYWWLLMTTDDSCNLAEFRTVTKFIKLGFYRILTKLNISWRRYFWHIIRRTFKKRVTRSSNTTQCNPLLVTMIKLYVQMRAEYILYGVFYALKYMALYDFSKIGLSVCSSKRGKFFTLCCPFAEAIPEIFQVNIWFFRPKEA